MIKTFITRLLRCVRWFLLGVLSLIALLGLIVWLGDTFFDNFFSIDACLDSGGAWDYKYERCVHATPENPDPAYQKAPDSLADN